MARRAYTPEEKANALELYATLGAAETARRTGISQGTLQSWAHRNGVQSVATERTRVAVEAARVRWEERRLAMVHEMGRVATLALTKAEEMLEAGTTSKAKDATTMMAILVDKAQLLSGAATSRTEVTERTPEVETELAKVLRLRSVA